MARRGHNEGSIYKRADGRWAASMTIRYEAGKLKRKTFYGKTRREVQEHLTKALRDKQQGMMPVVGPAHTLEAFLIRWLEDVVKPGVRVTSYVRYRQVVRDHLVPELGNKQLAKLGPEDAQALYAKKLGQGYAPRTVQYMHVMLHLALKYAVRWNLVPRNVTDVVNAPRIPRRDARVLTVEQAQRLLAAARGDRMEALFVLALTSGMREGELLGLKWEDIDLTCGTLSVRRTVVQLPPPYGWIESEPKSAQSRRSIKLAAMTISALHVHRARQLEQRVAAYEAWEDHDLVFPTKNGRRMSPTTLRMCHFRPLLRRAGIPYIRFHDLRHGAATLLLSMGIHPKVVQELLGHSQISITMDTYSHVLPTLQGEAVRRLGELLEGSE